MALMMTAMRHQPMALRIRKMERLAMAPIRIFAWKEHEVVRQALLSVPTRLEAQRKFAATDLIMIAMDRLTKDVYN
jgi:hypothetical protein